jgi:tetratricopeptide (TPR) repeat protein
MAEGDIESGKASLERALGLFRTLGNTVDAAQCLVGLAGVLRKEGDLERAMSLLTEALDLLPRDEERHISDNALMNLGEVAREYGDLHGAIAAYRESLVSAARESQAWVIAYCLEGLAAVAAATAQALTAARLLGAAEAFRSATGVQLRAIDRPHYDALVSEVQSELEQPVFEQVWASGRALPLADAISEALLVDVPVVATPLSGAQ